MEAVRSPLPQYIDAALLTRSMTGFLAGSVRMEELRLRHICAELWLSIVNVEYRCIHVHRSSAQDLNVLTL